MNPSSFDTLEALPVYARRSDILSSVDNNQVTIVVAETGAGKSTQIPQFLAEHGYQKVIVTQPRILAARNLSHRVREEYSWRMGYDCTKLVGYRTAQERDDSPETVILYCTDGLQLVRELTGIGTRDRQVLVLDEIHEWNENMEVLVAWAKKRCQEDPQFKVVLMSATIEADTLAAYFSAPPPISIEGRSYHVEKRHGRDIVTEVTELLETRTSNMLVFLPGKAEIEATAEAIQKAAKNVPVIPLHGQLEPEQQQLAFGHYPQGKVVLTTNVAQTSVTIDDIDVVVDSGLERRSEVRSGVEGLFIAQISQADCLQRAGRAGRTKEGLYILAQLSDMPCDPLEKRPAYGVPEIMRKHIDRLVLRLASIGIDIENLAFYHSPSRRTIKLAKRTLISLGALTSAGTVTEIGHKMERFPVESSYARMLVESEAYSPTIQATLAAIIAIQEVGGIVKGSPRFTGWRNYTQQKRSDLVAQYDVYLALPTIDPEDFEELGIIANNVHKAQEVHERLIRDFGFGDVGLTRITDADIEPILQCIVAGQLHQIWAVEPNGEATHIQTKNTRELSSGTVVKHARLVAGRPFDLEVSTARGLETLNLVTDVTAVNPAWLEQMDPDNYKVRPGGVSFNPHYGVLMRHMVVTYGNQTFETSGESLLESNHENQKLFVTHYAAWLHEQLEKEHRTLQSINSRRLPHIPLRQVVERVRHLADGAVSLAELPKKRRIELSRLGSLSPYLGERFMATLHTNPQTTGPRHGHHHRQKSWKPRHKRRYD